MKGINANEVVWSVLVADIADSGLHLEIEAPAEARERLAELAGLRTLPRLSAVFDLARQGSRVHVTGKVSATVGQTCVITLEPIDNAVEEVVDLTFAPMPVGLPAAEAAGRHGRVATEPPEPLIDGTIDLGALASEFLMLGIDPYPRKAGAQFAPPRRADDGPHPFAALEALKKQSGSGKS
jgi:hypothetical protein